MSEREGHVVPQPIRMTENRASVASLFTAKENRGVRLTVVEISRQCLVPEPSVPQVMSHFVYMGWFRKGLAPRDNRGGRRRHWFYLPAENVAALERLVIEFRSRQSDQGLEPLRRKTGVTPYRPEDDEPLTGYRPSVPFVGRGASRRAVFELFLEQPERSWTAAMIQTRMDKSNSWIRKILNDGVEDGLLVRTDVSKGLVVPQRYYTLTPSGLLKAKAMM